MNMYEKLFDNIPLTESEREDLITEAESVQPFLMLPKGVKIEDLPDDQLAILIFNAKERMSHIDSTYSGFSL